MTEKITLPRDVAEAIEAARNSFTDGEIISAAIGWNDYGEDSLITLRKWTREDSYTTRENELMSALVNGYNIKQSPEEKLREYYEDLRDSSEGSIYWSRSEGVLNTLSILGIQIEGINA